ncbi:FGGY-family carbohydrate kinase [Pararhizobium mangrovi]|uniref:Carbohydrate kinase n=1 Tax=Pararhizobium mangrovi TaxID=2590452 RepID=A0A506TXD2_9HYPH|nr:FGGY-family carbohydrate kinase [Pararhizobium mangrovi]TPW26170.1 carbohydrate kinase [Pararhizobium mangrovi]
MKDVIIGIDAGTSVIKSVAFDTNGVQLAMASMPNVYDTLEGGGVEQDMNLTWRKTAETLRALGGKVSGLAERTAGIAVTGQGDGTWLVGRDGEPVGGGLLWLDARAGEIVRAARQDPADRRRYELTGTGLNACQQGGQLQWLRRAEPERIEAAAAAFHCKDWLYHKLTGRIATDPSEGTLTFGDYRTLTYSDEVVSLLGLDDERRLMPEIVNGLERHDALGADAAGQTGLLAGTPVVLGYIDIVCTALGAGLYDRTADVGCSIVGSTGMHMRLARSVEAVTLDERASGYTIAMPVPGTYAQLQSNMAATLNIDWVLRLARDVLSIAGSEPGHGELMRALDRWVTTAEPGTALYQPYISEAGERGPFVDAAARAGFVGLSTRHGFADLARAVVEGLAFAGRDCYAAMGELPEEIRLTGGAARSPSLRRVFGAATHARMRTGSRQEAGAAGAAMIAAVRLGVYPSMEACCDAWVTPLLGEAEPCDETLARTYDRLFPAFVEAHQVLRPVWRSMAGRGTANGQGA